MVMVELAAKPLPVTVTTVPTVPLVGESEIDGTTLNVLLATCATPSAADTVWGPKVDIGTVKVALNEPVESVVIVVGDVV